MIRELVEIFLKSKGMKKISGSDNDASPLLPLIMMDSAFQLYCEYIKPVECKHEMKKWKNDWIKNYTAFNKEYFSCFNIEQTDYICDMMDEFEKFIEHDLFIAFIQFENLFIQEPLERQEVLAASMLANIHCQCAEIVWERLMEHCSTDKTNRHIIACHKIMHKWSDAYYGYDKPLVNPNKNKNICDAVDVLCKKQINFLRKYL